MTSPFRDGTKQQNRSGDSASQAKKEVSPDPAGSTTSFSWVKAPPVKQWQIKTSNSEPQWRTVDINTEINKEIVI